MLPSSLAPPPGLTGSSIASWSSENGGPGAPRRGVGSPPSTHARPPHFHSTILPPSLLAYLLPSPVSLLHASVPLSHEPQRSSSRPMAEAGAVAVEEAAGIICSLRAGDLAGWTPPWKSTPENSSPASGGAAAKDEEKAWPAVTRGKRSRSSRRRSPSGSGSAAKGRWARGSPASPLEFSGVSGSGASTSGGEDGAFCSPPATSTAACRQATATAAPPSSSAKQVGSIGARRALILPAPAPQPRPAAAGQRSRKKMRLPEVQQLVQSLAAENDGLRQEMRSLRRACTSLSKENSTLETRLVEHSSSTKRKRTGSEEEQQQGKPCATSGFVLPDLNIPAQDVADGSAAAAAGAL
uniref:Uncharacterized protein n=1 Tax=Avena sativa TaxID=4498 RepID=A0ACD6AB16_AVESA